MLYVNDCLIVGKEEKVNRVKEDLSKEFRMTDIEVKCFLGINVERMNKGLFLHQSNYLKQVLRRFEMENFKPVKPPMELKVNIESDNVCEKPYRELLGCLTYAAITTRPDISATLNYFSQTQSSPSETH